eukprot:CAMPEP_0181415700 /NCGR_PEP_ID=MMETSP1110-20121109/10148_1 /TAXON_ID=174948 /ORGANISM="Symbiodinium sp., Strain CCMP421" /LENGTH=184 /DNA_ID=CAMNT_0023538603 /DNA_START=1 /DNA_END=552 /DNA_ORIENTATION=-
MNFVRAETLVQEITGDGKVRDIVTQVKKSEAEKEAERKETVLRNLPEFKRDGQSAAEQIANNKEDEKDQDKEDKYNVHTIDEAEFEHYQLIEDAEREKKRKKNFEDAEAVALFETERKRFKEDGGDEKASDLISLMRQKNLQKAEKKSSAAPAAVSRLKGKITVKARTGETLMTPAEPAASLTA